VRVIATGAQPAKAFARRHQFEIGNPLDFDPQYNQVTAFEHLLAALGGDLAGGFRALARRHRLVMDNVEVVVTATLENPLVHLGVIGEEGTPAIERLTVRAFASSAEGESELRPLWDEVLRRSPLVQTLMRAAQLEVEVRFIH
jgi:hypothetical protein